MRTSYPPPPLSELRPAAPEDEAVASPTSSLCRRPPFPVPLPLARALARALVSRRMRPALVLLALLAVVGCTTARDDRNRPPTGRARDVVITAVPLLTREMAQVYPFLTQDFAPGGVLADKEVYAFLPAEVTVAEGDTLRLQLINPEDDEHNFVLPDLAVKLPGQSTTHATWIARRPGIYPFLCTVPKHMPMMRGQIVVLRRSAVRKSAD